MAETRLAPVRRFYRRGDGLVCVTLVVGGIEVTDADLLGLRSTLGWVLFPGSRLRTFLHGRQVNLDGAEEITNRAQVARIWGEDAWAEPPGSTAGGEASAKK